jgi:hypothetical protein
MDGQILAEQIAGVIRNVVVAGVRNKVVNDPGISTLHSSIELIHQKQEARIFIFRLVYLAS